MPRGTIKSLTDRGFGFIQPEEGGPDLFFHNSALQDTQFDDLRSGQTVLYDVEPDPRNANRERAVNVRMVSQ